jgi:hypothetical protein
MNLVLNDLGGASRSRPLSPCRIGACGARRRGTADVEEDDMSFRLRGTYVGHCDCTQICPCAVDEKPTGRNGQCHGLIVISIADGSLDDTDLSGTKVVFSYFSPGKISDGGLRLGLVIDNDASDEQADALERIFSGRAGGMFEAFAGLTDKWLGAERAAIGFFAGEEPQATIGHKKVHFIAFRGQDGNVTTTRNAVFGFAPEFTLGKSSGHSGVLGESFDANYAEAAQFEWAS